MTGEGITEKVVVVLSGGGIRGMRGEDERTTMGRSVERTLVVTPLWGGIRYVLGGWR